MTALAAILSVIFIVSVSNAKPPQKIVGGTFATTGEFPSIVSLRIDSKHVCAGAILDEYHVLTAASCLVSKITDPYENLDIAVGTKKSNSGVLYKAWKIVVPKNFDKRYPLTSFNDIAVIKMRSKILFNNYIGPIELPTVVSGTGRTAVTAGWGLLGANDPSISNELARVTLTTVTASECQLYTERTISSRQICAFSENSGLCLGDGGNPLISNNQLIGIATYYVGCSVGTLDVFTSTYHYLDWINDMMSLDGNKIRSAGTTLL